MWTPEVAAAVKHWRFTGIFPFPDLGVYPSPVTAEFTIEDLRLLHHVASISNEMRMMDANGYTLWTRHIPM